MTATRTFSAAPTQRPLTAARFRLAHGGRLRVSVWQERPRCRFFGRYTVPATRGENALRLPRRVGRHAVVAGTYRLLGVAGKRTVVDLRVRVVRKDGRLRVRHTTLASTCTQPAQHTLLFAAVPLPTVPLGTGGGSKTAASPGPDGTRTAAVPPGGHPFAPPRLVVRMEQAVRNTLLYVLLALAIVLFAAGALPRTTAVGGPAAGLARHRAALTSAGLALIAAAVLAALLR